MLGDSAFRFGTTALKDDLLQKIGELMFVSGQKLIKTRESQRQAEREALFKHKMR